MSICFDSLPEKTHHIHAFSGLKVPTKYVKASEFYLLITQKHWIFPSLIPNVRNPSYLNAIYVFVHVILYQFSNFQVSTPDLLICTNIQKTFMLGHYLCIHPFYLSLINEF